MFPPTATLANHVLLRAQRLNPSPTTFSYLTIRLFSCLSEAVDMNRIAVKQPSQCLNHGTVSQWSRHMAVLGNPGVRF